MGAFKQTIGVDEVKSCNPILNLFYEEPDDDRWFRFDRFPRRLIRRVVRGKRRPGGHERVFLNLCAGLDRVGIRYRINNYRYARRHPEEAVCIIGKAFVLDKVRWHNPIIFGVSGYAHPIDDMELPSRLPIRKILVPGEWSRDMFRLYWGELVEVWPVGIDTNAWRPQPGIPKTVDVLLYDKVRWKHDEFEATLIGPVRRALRNAGHSVHEIRYGYYYEEEFKAALAECRAMVFLCEHETQGIAYQQALSCGVPIFAWDRGGYWQDPVYFPDRIKFSPVSSVPYWDERCGMKFGDADTFVDGWEAFLDKATKGGFHPRDYILEELTLEKCALEYVDLVKQHTEVIV
jgi:hypothetical protein